MRRISRYETRTIRPAPGVARKQHDFVEVSLDYTGSIPLLQLIFSGSIYYEMPAGLALDFGERIARSMVTRPARGSRRELRIRPGMSRADRDFVGVYLHDDFDRTWLRLEFHDGNVFEFSTDGGKEFGDRIARAMTAMPSVEPA